MCLTGDRVGFRGVELEGWEISVGISCCLGRLSVVGLREVLEGKIDRTGK